MSTSIRTRIFSALAAAAMALTAGASFVTLTATPASAYSYSSDFLVPDANSRYLSESELTGYDKDTLDLMKNEIYARRGYIFSSQEYKDYFGAKSWYVGKYTYNDFVKNVKFNQYEQANIMLLGDLAAKAKTGNSTMIGNTDYLIADSDSRYLSESELTGYDKDTLDLMKNEIYARRGYIFSSQEYKDYFGAKPWYVARYTYNDFVKNVQFNQYEQANIMLLGDLAAKAKTSTTNYAYNSSAVVHAEGTAGSNYYLNLAPDGGYLTREMLSDYSKGDLQMILNTYYARKGYIFSDSNLQSTFSSFYWYTPRYTASEFYSNVTFNEYETANMNLLYTLIREK